MATNEDTDSSPAIQADIYRLALSLDSLFVNGIQFGLFQPALSNGLVEKLSDAWRNDLEAVRKSLPHAPAGEQPKVRKTLDELCSESLDLTDLLARLSSFRAFSRTELLAAVSRLGGLRENAVRLIAELEKALQTSKPFYATRPEEASAAVERFIADLPRNFEMEWNRARAGTSAHSA